MNSISCKNLSKTYFIEKESLLVLRNIELIINEGDRLAITGKSGSGKSSLLHILAGLDAPTTGSISYNENNYEFNKPDTLRSLRLGNFGFVYQFHHLLDDLTVEENILIPCHLNHSYSKLMIDKAKKIMKNLDIYKRKNHLPWKLSGGEKQRTAIARSIINNPKFLFLDEPTGNLDNENGRLIQEVLMNISKENNIALITATHDNEFIKSFNRVYRLSESNLYSI
tara:strand:- start:13865 stop:14539 length:675 start_codon:yes stop_codon:yes gene_type:complete